MGLDSSFLWWEPPKESPPVEFCRDTALHGLKYIGQPKRNMIERIFWLAAFIVGIVVACILIHGIWQKYKTTPIITTFANRPANVHQIPFPAITLCNVNSISRVKAEEIIRDGYSGKEEALARVSLLNHVCSATTVSFSQKFGYIANGSSVPKELLEKVKGLRTDAETILNITMSEFLNTNAQTCEDMILLCLWKNKRKNCSEFFRPIETDFGKCCTFNMVPRTLLWRFEPDDRDSHMDVLDWKKSKLSADEYWMDNEEEDGPRRKYPRRVDRAGRTNGLSILINPGVKDYFCTGADIVGFEFQAHQPTAVPNVAELGSGINPNSEVFVSINPDIVNAQDSLRAYDVATRKCYFNNEFNLKFFEYYTQANCLDECVSNITYEKCHCVAYYMPRDPGPQDICAIDGFNCVEIAAKQLEAKSIMGNSSKCLPTCNDVTYTTEVHHGLLRNDVEIWLKKNGVKDDWAALQVSVVHFYFGYESTYPKSRKEVFGLVDLLASTGGILGFCLGFSALSLLEIFYFLTIRLYFVIHRRKFAETEVLGHSPSTIQPDNILIKPGPILYPNFFYHEMLGSYRHRPNLLDAYK